MTKEEKLYEALKQVTSEAARLQLAFLKLQAAQGLSTFDLRLNKEVSAQELLDEQGPALVKLSAGNFQGSWVEALRP